MGREETYVYILLQQLIRNPILLQDIIIHPRARQRASKEETKQSVHRLAPLLLSIFPPSPFISSSTSTSTAPPLHRPPATQTNPPGNPDHEAQKKTRLTPHEKHQQASSQATESEPAPSVPKSESCARIAMQHQLSRRGGARERTRGTPSYRSLGVYRGSGGSRILFR